MKAITAIFAATFLIAFFNFANAQDNALCIDPSTNTWVPCAQLQATISTTSRNLNVNVNPATVPQTQYVNPPAEQGYSILDQFRVESEVEVQAETQIQQQPQEQYYYEPDNTGKEQYYDPNAGQQYVEPIYQDEQSTTSYYEQMLAIIDSAEDTEAGAKSPEQRSSTYTFEDLRTQFPNGVKLHRIEIDGLNKVDNLFGNKMNRTYVVLRFGEERADFYGPPTTGLLQRPDTSNMESKDWRFSYYQDTDYRLDFAFDRDDLGIYDGMYTINWRGPDANNPTAMWLERPSQGVSGTDGYRPKVKMVLLLADPFSETGFEFKTSQQPENSAGNTSDNTDGEKGGNDGEKNRKNRDNKEGRRK